MAPRVIVSDDELPLLRSLTRLFRREGVETVEDQAGDVVALAERAHPDLVMIDLHHRVSGLDLLRQLRANPATHALPVIIMSGDDSPTDRETALALGALDFVVKPFANDLVSALARRLRGG